MFDEDENLYCLVNHDTNANVPFSTGDAKKILELDEKVKEVLYGEGNLTVDVSCDGDLRLMISVRQFNRTRIVDIYREKNGQRISGVALIHDHYALLMGHLKTRVFGNDTPDSQKHISAIDFLACVSLAEHTRIAVNRLSREGCHGCKIDHPSQKNHSCLMRDAEEHLEDFGHEAFGRVGSLAQETFNESLRTLARQHIPIFVKEKDCDIDIRGTYNYEDVLGVLREQTTCEWADVIRSVVLQKM